MCEAKSHTLKCRKATCLDFGFVTPFDCEEAIVSQTDSLSTHKMASSFDTLGPGVLWRLRSWDLGPLVGDRIRPFALGHLWSWDANMSLDVYYRSVVAASETIDTKSILLSVLN